MIVFPGFVLFFQSFDWIHELCSGCRHFERNRNVFGQSFHTNEKTKWRRVLCRRFAQEVSLYFLLRNCDASALKVIHTQFMSL